VSPVPPANGRNYEMKILIAEDDELLRTLLEDYLLELGHAVKSAANGVELVKLALQERPELVITDLHMPEMTGGSMIAMLDMYSDLSGLPVIIISGATKAELADMGIPKGIPILPKPFDFARIALELQRAGA
jgi:two-component system, OmpR family, phosphate regulon response regulator PhoB